MWTYWKNYSYSVQYMQSMLSCSLHELQYQYGLACRWSVRECWADCFCVSSFSFQTLGPWLIHFFMKSIKNQQYLFNLHVHLIKNSAFIFHLFQLLNVMLSNPSKEEVEAVATYDCILSQHRVSYLRAWASAFQLQKLQRKTPRREQRKVWQPCQNAKNKNRVKQNVFYDCRGSCFAFYSLFFLFANSWKEVGCHLPSLLHSPCPLPHKWTERSFETLQAGKQEDKEGVRVAFDRPLFVSSSLFILLYQNCRLMKFHAASWKLYCLLISLLNH